MEDEIREKLKDICTRMANLHGFLEIDKKKETITELEKTSSQEDFWKDADNAKTVLKDLDENKEIVSNFTALDKNNKELEELLEIAVAENDEQSIKVIYDEVINLEDDLNKIELINKFS